MKVSIPIGYPLNRLLIMMKDLSDSVASGKTLHDYDLLHPSFQPLGESFLSLKVAGPELSQSFHQFRYSLTTRPFARSFYLELVVQFQMLNIELPDYPPASQEGLQAFLVLHTKVFRILAEGLQQAPAAFNPGTSMRQKCRN